MNKLEIIVKEKDIKKKIKETGNELAQTYKDKNPLVIGIINGAIYFLTELTQNMDIDLEIELMGLSSYGANTTSSGKINITKDLNVDVENRHIIIVEDIIDTGITLNYLKEYFKNKNAKSIETISLFIKEHTKENSILPDRALIEIPNDFVVGFGLDYANKYRHLKDLCILHLDETNN